MNGPAPEAGGSQDGSEGVSLGEANAGTKPRIGIVAGSGALPVAVAEDASRAG